MKYMVYAERGDEELYDLANDPWETRNQVPSATLGTDSALELERMRSALVEHMTATNDLFPGLEAKAGPRWRSHRAGYQHHHGIAAPQA